MNKRILLALAALALTACTHAPKSELATLKSKGLKRYVVWNKRQFIKPAGQVTMNATTILNMAKALNATDVNALDRINGFTITAPEHAALAVTGGDWEVQEELEHHTMQTLYEITPKQCPPVNPAPQCPQCPTCPVNPGPGPGPTPTPIETARSWGLTRMKALEAKAKVDTSSVKVCVVDDGADLSHPNVGRVIASQSYTGEPVSPGGGHGAHTAGTIAGTGGVGVSKAQLQICKGLSNRGSGSSTQLAQCLVWCGSQGAHIVSNSWGSTQSDALINQAIAQLTAKGIAVVVANGNDSRGQLNWPAALAQSNALVFGVAASDQSDRKASFSTYGPGTRFIAPGVDIVSNRPGGGVVTSSGTSMSTPGVAGAMAYCVKLQKPFSSCLKTDVLGLGANVEGAGLPNLWSTVQ